ncbi:thioredoxin family protein [Parachlamydia sp. AcF125]|uniref:thioredoxin family protein n=1 Tax=Parachlamydia sp. AcF125 TaxID=2795736 RepID=UPI001BC9F5CF|nr:thioredoxin family protein [Parachlamydia sp. AcF125]
MALFLMIGTVNFASDISPKAFSVEGKTISPIEEIGEQNFSIKIEKGYVVVEFFAHWCGSCQAFEPIFTKVAQDMQESVTFYKVDIDTSWSLVEQYGVENIPTLIIFRGGIEASRHASEMAEESLREFILANF